MHALVRRAADADGSKAGLDVFARDAAQTSSTRLAHERRAACPPGGTPLSYDAFGHHFFDAYWVRCHGWPNGYSSRGFTAIELIRLQRDRIFVNAASDSIQPPGPDGPSPTKREALAP